MRRDPIESLIFFLGVLAVAFIARYCRKSRFSLGKAFAYGVLYGLVFIGFIVIYAYLSPVHSLDTLSNKYLPLAGIFCCAAFGSWCAYEVHRGQLEDM